MENPLCATLGARSFPKIGPPDGDRLLSPEPTVAAVFGYGKLLRLSRNNHEEILHRFGPVCQGAGKSSRLCYLLNLGGPPWPRPETMTRKLFSLVLLATFGLGLFLGPHPCGASHGERKSARQQMSCHAPAPAAAGEQVRAEAQEEDGNGCGDFCRHACHMTAIAAPAPAAFAFSPVSGAAGEPSGSGLPLFAHPIDHIPLA